MFGNLGFTELLVIGGILALLFGHRRLPELAKGLGQGLRSFRKELSNPDSATPVEGQPPAVPEPQKQV